MLAHSQLTKQARRGIVLVLVLAMLGLLALIGVTFATFSGQAKINSRNFFFGVLAPQDDELMDFALSQLITDTGDAHSAIHGHSLARDMYGSDANSNGYLPLHPTYGTPFYIVSPPQQVSTGIYHIQTNIQSNDPNFYGYSFRRWIVRISYAGTPSGSTATTPFGVNATLAANAAVNQTFEVTADSGYNSGNSSGRILTVAVLDPSTTTNTSITNQTYGGNTTSLINWTQNAASLLPSYYLAQAAANNATPGQSLPFSLDGRWLRAFNGPGMGANAYLGNFRYNGLNPAGMDEDYDACDLENWFLAIQSADGQVVIPSFHRPGIIRHDPANNVSDWSTATRFPNGLLGIPRTDSLSRILRPVAADGNDPATFPDLIPDSMSGKITYDVDNDGDGVTDSVWLDLGYPSRRDSRGQLYKPLFAFMVIGLNGRIPLNTAGNLAGQSTNTTGNNALSPTYAHTQHLGNTVSEIDPTYGLQNAFASDFDPFNTVNSNLTWPPSSSSGISTNNTQVDNSKATYVNGNLVYATGGQDVRLTQLRNLLAGTRPQNNPLAPDTTGLINGDTNTVYGQWAGNAPGTPFALPNSIADGADLPQPATYSYTDGQGNVHPLIVRTTAPVGGRWGEAASIPGVPFANPAGGNGPPLNLVQSSYANPIRAGYSFDVSDLLTAISAGNAYDSNGDPIFPRDAADDNYNAFDVFPPRLTGEVGDADFYDAAGAFLLPVERMRRFVTPVDINGSGRVAQFTDTVSNNVIRRGSNLGPDNYGRVQFSSYFRPAGSPGVISTQYTYSAALGTYTAVGAALGSILYPTGAAGDPFYTSGPNNFINYLTPYPYGTTATAPAPVAITTPHYLPDMTNNPFHGFESYKIPNLLQNPGAPITGALPAFSPTNLGGMPIDVNAMASANLTGQGATAANVPSQVPALPTVYPTYDNKVNSSGRLDGVNEADEMNLYSPNPLLDSPFEPSDLEWLYRQQDIDGSTMSSRLAQLAPVSFTNTIDGLRRRRLYALDSWESNNFTWANDNPQGAFAYNSRFSPNASPTFLGLNQPTPTLAQRDKKININFPLPVSNDCNEPVRQKWISDTYRLLKTILPPDSVDTAEELAQLSQFVINIIDFRDPDGTMTHWINPDVFLTPSTAQFNYPTLTLNIGGGNLDQYGMEYNPVAINEVLAYSYQSLQAPKSRGTVIQNSRFCVELVNTLTAAYNPSYDYGNPTNPSNYYANQASTLDLGGFNYITPSGTTLVSDPYGAGCWDLVFTADDGWSRPDPYRGELVYNPTSGATNYYSLIPLNRDSFFQLSSTTPNPNIPVNTPNNGDVSLIPVNPNPPGNANTPNTTPVNLPNPNPAPTPPSGTAPTGGLPITYFYVVGNPPQTNFEKNPISISYPSTSYPALTQTLLSPYDPMPPATTTYNAQGVGSTVVSNPPPTINWRAGILPNGGNSGQPSNYAWDIPPLGLPSQTTSSPGNAKFYWVCLRRPANPFAPVSATNPMCVVDSMRFPYIDGTASTWKQDSTGNWYVYGSANTIYSAQRLQPYRGGQAVPPPYLMATPTSNTTVIPPDSRYGYTEQISTPVANGGSQTYGLVSANSTYPATPYIQYHSLGQSNNAAENWDYLVFNDRDFSSVAELMLVPGCPPGLFTKQFVEFAPSQINAANVFSAVTPVIKPAFAGSTIAQNAGNNGPVVGGTRSVPVTTFGTATAPFFSVSQATPFPAAVNSQNYQAPTAISAVPGFAGLSRTQPANVNVPLEPHSFPYLVDKFFYTGASTFLYPPLVPPNVNGAPAALPGLGGAGATDPSNAGIPVVGGPAADGWFKMFDFFEVPSQSIGSVGPVIQGNNFDWARQDTKPGLMNLNLIIDEEAFFAVFGRQNSSFTQTLLNGIQLPSWPYLPYANNGATMPLTNYVNNNSQPMPPIPNSWAPLPLVVSAIQANGAPNYVYPLVDQFGATQQGYLATDPIQTAINGFNYPSSGMVPTPPGVGNRIKAAFAQFLWLRHGGSGYLFGFGTGATGQNIAVNTNGQINNQPIPAERPFHSLSYPDINYTIMRPAALPPSGYTNPPMLVNTNTPALSAATNAQALIYTPTTLPTTNWYWLNSQAGTEPNFYAPFVTGNEVITSAPIVYTGDPGVRNPFLSQGYAISAAANNSALSPYPLYPTQATNSVPAGVPLPVNLAWTGASGTVTDGVVLPPAVPPVRLFQTPDAFGAGAMMIYGYNGTVMNPPPVSNATDSGDPWINNTVPYPAIMTMPTTGTYALNNGFPSIVWPWMAGTTPNNTAVGAEYGVGGTTTNPPNPATGVLPPVSWYQQNNQGTLVSVLPTTATSLTLGSTTPYLGSVSGVGSATPTATDDRQHPYWRTEQLQSAMNLTTVRTHQYAVWITIGFFEVKRQGDIGMLAQATPQLAYDTLGPEIGALSGSNVRYRGFFLIDRLKLTGYNPGNVGGFRAAVVYRKVIQ